MTVIFSLLIAIACASCTVGDVQDDLRTIRNQLNVLMEKRQEDYKQLEKSLYESLSRNTDIEALKEDVRSLKDERSEVTHVGNEGIRDKIAVGWLKEVIGSLRTEMQSVWSAINETARIRRTVAVQNDLQALRKDLDSDRRDLQAMQGELLSVRKCVDDMAVKHSELEKTVDDAVKRQKAMDTKNNENDVDNSVYKQVTFGGNDDDSLRTNVITTVVTDREAHELDRLKSSRRSLEHRMARLEKRLKGVLYRESGAVERENRLSRLEADLNATKRALAFNATRQDATQDRLHGSLLELLESVENLDDRVDACLPEVRKEMSKIEFAVARMNASVAIIKEDQNNQMLTTKALGEGMSAMQRKMSKYEEKIEKRKRKTTPVRPMTGKNCRSTECTRATTIDELQEDTSRNSLETVADDNGLPEDCSKMKSSGTYVIAPAAAGVNNKPLLVHCDISDGMSWITVQRRTNDRVNFNRNWDEYANGFGDLNGGGGDFWLGNEAIHRLTANNASSLRVHMTDIYGNVWLAVYERVAVSSAVDGYRLTVSGYGGAGSNASDALSYQNGRPFSTADRDQDDSATTNCAAAFEGGWWYSRCQHANVNGKHDFGMTWFDVARNRWLVVAKTRMSVGRPAADRRR